MKRRAPIFRSGDPVERVYLSALETDQILVEVSRLYRDRVEALRTGDIGSAKRISDAIASLKAKLNP